MFSRLFSLIATGLALASVVSSNPLDLEKYPALHRRATYTNPLVSGGAADPWVLQYNNFYYLLVTTGGNVQVRKSSTLGSFNVAASTVYTPPSPYTDVWAPELHQIDGAFYIYVAMAKNGDNASHRMYVLKGTSTTDPTAPFNFVGQITSPDNNWAIDGTVLRYQNGVNYFIWSGWTDPSNTLVQNLYIARMSSPTAITGNRVLLHEPTPAWQQSGSSKINEGPEILVNAGRTFLVYSVAGSWTREYALALMGIDNGADPLVHSNWWTKDDNAVFWQSDVAFGPGHASFPYDRNGVPYIVYHAMADPNAGWAGRTVRTQTFKWNTDNSPWFPTPGALGAALPAPA